MSLQASFCPITLKGANEDDSKILQEYAEFWKIPYQLKAPAQKDSVVITSDKNAVPNAKDYRSLILAPTGPDDAQAVASEAGINVTTENRLVRLPIGKTSHVALTGEFYRFSGSQVEHLISADAFPVLSRLKNNNIYLIALDLVAQYSRIVYRGLEDPPSSRFKLVTKLPFSYKAIPSFIRNRSFRTNSGTSELREETLGPVEFLRTIFLASLVTCAGPIPRIGFWRRGKTYVVSVTHDVETEEGLASGAPVLMAVEANLQISSTWNVPSDRYPLAPSALDKLAQNGEIGAHDSRHDGRLILLDTREKTQRLAECKSRLEKSTGRKVVGFRAPLLQHDKDLLIALSDAGFELDSSCPSWEILSPTSLKPHGVGTIFPFLIGNLVEIPVSLPQDHQLIRVAGLQPSAAVDLLLRLSNWIQSIGGVCVILTHPDYEFAAAEHKQEYDRLLSAFRSDPECEMMTLRELAEWWKMRSRARLEIDNGKVSIVSAEHSTGTNLLQSQLVTGFGPDGFNVASLS